jgi:replication fork protection complex subunit Tof1/Swi1
MKLVGLTTSGAADDPEASWTVPSSKSADQLQEALDLIKKFEFSPPTFDDGKEAADHIRRVSAGLGRKRAVFDDESDNGIDDDSEEELLFEPGGPTAMKKSDALKALKKSRRRRRKSGSEEGEGLSDEILAARAEARRLRELEKNAKVKSEKYVVDSDEDEEADRVFFEAEERLRNATKVTIMKELLHVGAEKGNGKARNKRDSSAIDLDSDEEDSEPARKKRGSSAIELDSDGEMEGAKESEEEAEATDTPMSSPHRSSQPKRRKVVSDNDDDEPLVSKTKSVKVGVEVDDEEDEENIVPVAQTRRPRVRAGFIMDSSDDE